MNKKLISKSSLVLIVLLLIFSGIFSAFAQGNSYTSAPLKTIEDVERMIDLGALIKEHYIEDFPRVAGRYEDSEAYLAYLNGVWLSQSREYEEALKAFNQARALIKERPNDQLEMLVLEKSIEIHEVYGDYVNYQADAMALRAVSAGIDDKLYIKALYAIANAHFQTYNDQAAKSYLTVIFEESTAIDYSYGLSRYHFLYGNIELSYDNLENADYHYRKAYAYLTEAEKILGYCYSDALELKLSMLERQNGESERAFERIENLLKNGKAKSSYLLREIYFDLGLSAFDLGKHQEAIRFYEEALVNDFLVDKTYNIEVLAPDIYMEMAHVYADLGEYEKAFDYVKLSGDALDGLKSDEIISNQVSALNAYEIDELQRELALKQKLRDANEKTIEMQRYYLKVGYALVACLFLALIFLLWMYYMRSKIQKRLYLETITDHLTKVFNRGHIIDVLEENKSPQNCVLMMDVDNFKMINDTFGHLVGDQVLVKIAEVISSNLREEDMVGRYGGEEFLVVLRNTPMENGLRVSERILESVRTIDWKEDIVTTLSIGLLQCHEGDTDELLAEADLLMYRAKNLGKNRVVF